MSPSIPDINDPSQNEVHTVNRPELDPRLNFGKHGTSTSGLVAILKSIKIGTDLSKISAPVSYLAGQSALEARATWTRPTEYLLNVHEIEDPVKRMENIVLHMMANLLTAIKDTFLYSKPYNPVLGEVFRCYWEHEDSITEYVSEQVSHHPPISAHCVYNLKKHFIIEACQQMKMYFRGTHIRGDMVGKNVIRILNHDEEYLCEGPGMHGFGLLLGPSGFEPNGKLIIVNEKHNLRAKFKVGKKKVDGKIQLIEGKKKTVLKRFKGSQLGIIEEIGATDSNSPWYNLDTLAMGSYPKVKPLNQQAENESRRLWHPVTYELFFNKNEPEGQRQKEIIEQRQRDLQAERKKAGTPFTPVLFEAGPNFDGVPFYRYKNIAEICREVAEGIEEIDEALD